MKTTWILVANQVEARIYSSKRLPGNLILLDTLTHEEGAFQTRDLISDAPGRAFDSMGSGRHSMEPDTGVKEESRRRFVKKMVARLESAHFRGDYDRLVLLAAPAVLGVIRKTISKKFTNVVVKEIPKDVIGQDLDKIKAQLRKSFELK